MRGPRIRSFALLALGSLFAAIAAAQDPQITVAGAPPWTDFSAVNTQRLILCFERDPTLDSTSIPLALPSAGTFTFTKDGAPCAIADAANCSAADPGSEVTDPASIGDDIEVMNAGESAGPFAFTADIQSTFGNWQTTGTPTPNTIQCVWAIPDVELDCPAFVASGAVGVTLDASASHSVYEPAASAPPLATVTWTPLAGAPAVTTSGPLGAIARFDAPVVAADTDLQYQVDVSDGTLSATQVCTVTVSPPDLPVDAVLLIDTSGSMGWHRTGSANDLVGGCCSRLASAKLAARAFVERLGTLAPSSQAGVVIFPGEPVPSTVWAKQFTPAAGLSGSVDFPTVISDIGAESVGCGDCLAIPGAPGAPTGIPVNWNGTPTRPGLELAGLVLSNASPVGTTTRVIVLLSDGAWNAEGDPTDPFFLATLSSHDIVVYTIGMGTGTDNVEHGELEDISVGTGVGTAGNPIGFTAFEFGDPASEPNLVPFFEKIMADMVSLSFTTDPSDQIGPGETRTHRFPVTEHDTRLSVTVSWESSAQGLLDFTLVSPLGDEFEPQVSGNGYRSATLGGERLTTGAVGEWQIRVTFPQRRGQQETGRSALPYNYSVVVDSELDLDLVFDRDRYFTGSTMVVEARPTELNRRLVGATVEMLVTRPELGIGNWHADNMVGAGDLAEIPKEISGEPLTLLDRKNYHLVQNLGVALPGKSAPTTVALNDAGVDGDARAGDGIYTASFSGFLVPGVYEFFVRATGTTRNGNPFVREMQVQKFVDVGFTPERIAGSLRFAEFSPGPFLPPELSERLGREPPRGFERTAAILVPEDEQGNLLGPGWGRKIAFRVTGAELLGVVDNLDGSYTGVIQHGLGTTPTVQVSIGEVTSPEVPAAKEGPAGIPLWFWIVLAILLILLIILVLRRI